jgi:DNA-binding NarL/FixJ family response regulator
VGGVTNPLAGKVLSRPKPLTDKQLKVMELLAQGMTLREIAAFMCYSPRTIETHSYEALNRLDANNRTHAIAICYHTGIFQTGDPT